MKRLIRQLRPHMAAFLVCMLCVVLANLSEIAKPAVLAYAIDTFLTGGAVQSGLYSLFGVGVVYFLVAAMGALCAYGRRCWWQKSASACCTPSEATCSIIFSICRWRRWTGSARAA